MPELKKRIKIAPSILSADFAKLGETKPLFKQLAEICTRNKGLWSIEAESFLLANFAKQ